MKRDLGDLNLKGAAGKKTSAPRNISRTFERCLVYFGILLPLAAILVENQFHICAKFAFDPFPSSGHLMLGLMIPAAAFLSWLSLRFNAASQFGPGLLANGMAVGVALLYSLMFWPLACNSLALFWNAFSNWYSPAAVFLAGATVFVCWAPLIALIVLWLSGRYAARQASAFGTFFCPHQVKNAGHLVILLAVLALELPSTITRVALGMAASPDPASQAKGLSILRTIGSREVMLRACYERSGRATDVLGSLYEASHPTDYKLMRGVFYKATGRTFNSFPIPEEARATMSHMGQLANDGINQNADDEFDADPDVAGELVSGVSRGLSVSQSKIDAKVDSDSGVSKIDWFLDFNNKSKYDREVRTRIKLPHGAAISEAALVVNGVQYKCKITLKEQARQIYRAAVESKRNPLLVSLAGEDTVLVQCYPVPPGNRLSLHLAAVSPLTLDKDMHGVLSLPQFEERNFQIGVPHTISISANHEIENFKDQLDKASYRHEKDKFGLTGYLDCAKLSSGAAVVKFQRGKDDQFWCKDRSGAIVNESIADLNLGKPARLFVVIDGSVFMQDYMKEIADALKKLPQDKQLRILVAGDDKIAQFTLKDLDKLADLKCVGGQLDGRILYPALSAVTRQPDSAVLWIHGQQPAGPGMAGMPLPAICGTAQNLDVASASFPVDSFIGIDNLPSLIKQLIPARAARTVLYDMQLSSGPNAFLDGVDSAAVQKVPRFGTCGHDLELLFEAWEKPGAVKAFVQSEVLSSSEPPGCDIKPVPHCGPVGVNDHSAMCDLGTAPDLHAAARLSNEAASTPSGRETMTELAQIWASNQIHNLVRAGDDYAALRLAERFNLVTPVSSAVLVDTVPDLEKMSCPEPLVGISDSVSAMPSSPIPLYTAQPARVCEMQSSSCDQGTVRTIDRSVDTQLFNGPAGDRERAFSHVGKASGLAEIRSTGQTVLPEARGDIKGTSPDARGDEFSSNSNAGKTASNKQELALRDYREECQTDAYKVKESYELKAMPSAAPTPLERSAITAKMDRPAACLAPVQAPAPGSTMAESMPGAFKDPSTVPDGIADGSGGSGDLAGASSGSVGLHEADRTVISGVNSAGCVRATAPACPVPQVINNGASTNIYLNQQNRFNDSYSYDSELDWVEVLRKGWFTLLGFMLALFLLVYKYVDGLIGKAELRKSKPAKPASGSLKIVN